MTDIEANPWDKAVIDDLRVHGGVVTEGPLVGDPLLIMTSTGAKSGKPRVAVLTFTRDDGDYVVAGTASGSPIDPGWLHNVEANPDVTVETEGRTFEARATIVQGAERDRLWDRHVDALPKFAAYPEQAGRVIPMVRITPNSKS
jgi:deazaflavin-dependent oxidoreductase (nitroreductase family)